MPIFTAFCNKCKKEFEEIRKIADADGPYYCPDCGRSCKQTVAKPGRFIRGRGNWSSPA